LHMRLLQHVWRKAVLNMSRIVDPEYWVNTVSCVAVNVSLNFRYGRDLDEVVILQWFR